MYVQLSKWSKQSLHDFLKVKIDVIVLYKQRKLDINQENVPWISYNGTPPSNISKHLREKKEGVLQWR